MLDADALRDIAALLVQMADRFEAGWTPQEKDKLVTYGVRLRASTFAAIEERAKTEKIPSERVICRALAQAGLRVAPGDLDTTHYRRIA